MAQLHQLAAIAFTDIVGYTAMMQEDENTALENINRFRGCVENHINRFNGRLIQYYGDGCLLLFTSAVNAVLFSKFLQQEFDKEPVLPVRVGIHMGDVLVKDGNVFGDAVNIASRIQSLAPPGRIYVSEAVHENTRNKREAGSLFIKDVMLKNVQSPMGIYDVVMDRDERPRVLNHFVEKNYFPVNSDTSIAVLPFNNISGDPEQEYFSEGMADEIINSLTHLQDVKVAGRVSSLHVKNNSGTARELGRKLGVNSVLEGSIRKQGSRLRITAQLVNVEDGFHVWSEKYDREMNDIFAIQDEIALSITEKLKIVLLKKDRELLTKTHTTDPEAYDLYLKGRFFLNRRGASIVSSLQYFQNAIAIDPAFALAYTGYADACLLLGNYGLAPPKAIMPKAKDAAEKAILLDPALAEPYCSLGFYHTLYEWNWTEAKKNFLRSLQLNPRYAQAHSWYGWNYVTMVEGKFSEGEQHGEALIKLEPLNGSFYGTFSLTLYTVGKLEKALEICRIGRELDANSFLCLISEGNILMDLGRNRESIAAFEKANSISNRHHFAVNGLIWNYCILGEMEQAHDLMNELKYRSEKEYLAKSFLGLSAAYMGRFDEAFDYLEMAFEDRDPILLNLKYENWGPAAFRNDPRFQRLLKRIGFPE
jgi:TolB-like protein/class 3 adenylate cyclase